MRGEIWGTLLFGGPTKQQTGKETKLMNQQRGPKSLMTKRKKKHQLIQECLGDGEERVLVMGAKG